MFFAGVSVPYGCIHRTFQPWVFARQAIWPEEKHSQTKAPGAESTWSSVSLCDQQVP